MPNYKYGITVELVKVMRRRDPGIRRGQAVFNYLLENEPKFAESIRGTDLDPFHLEGEPTPEFWVKLIEEVGYGQTDEA